MNNASDLARAGKAALIKVNRRTVVMRVEIPEKGFRDCRYNGPYAVVLRHLLRKGVDAGVAEAWMWRVTRKYNSDAVVCRLSAWIEKRPWNCARQLRDPKWGGKKWVGHGTMSDDEGQRERALQWLRSQGKSRS